MDVYAIRTDLAAVGFDNGYPGAAAYVPESVSTFPAWIVGVPTEVEGFTPGLGQAKVTLPVTVAVRVGSYQDAQHALDDVVSTSVAGSAVNLLTAARSDNWTKVHVVSAGNIRFSDDADAKVLAVDIEIEVFARK